MSIKVQNSTAPPTVAKYCIDRATEAVLTALTSQASPNTCPVFAPRFTKSGGSVDSVFRLGTTIETSHTVFDMGETNFHSRSDIRTSASVGPGTRRMIVGEAHWVGSCPRGMKPGELVTANGIHMKLAPDTLRLPK